MLRRGPAAHVRATLGKELQRNVWTEAVDLRHVQTEHGVQGRLHIEREAVMALILDAAGDGTRRGSFEGHRQRRLASISASQSATRT